MTFISSHTYVPISQELLDDAQWYRDALREAWLDHVDGPRYGPPVPPVAPWMSLNKQPYKATGPYRRGGVA